MKLKTIVENVYVLMPVLDEVENLKWLLPQLVDRWNVIIVDNGSTDGSFELAQRENVVSIMQPRRGYGSVVKMGIDHLIENKLIADDGIVIVFDADASSPVSEIDPLVNLAKSHQSSMVLAQRMQQERGSMPVHAKFGNWLQPFLIGLITGYRYKDMGPMRALSIRAYKDMELEDVSWGWNVEMQIKAVTRGVKIVERDIQYFKRKFGHSKISGSVIGSIRAAIKILYCVGYYGLKEILLKKTSKVGVETK